MTARLLEAAKSTYRLALAVAFRSGEAENLAAVDLEGDVAEARATEVADRQYDIGRLLCRSRGIFGFDRTDRKSVV